MNKKKIKEQVRKKLPTLAKKLAGDLHYDQLMRVLYATDASVYKELPLAVALPKSKQDIKSLIAFAKENKCSLIPRAAGTSLAGQCVGDGIVVDISKYFTQIIELNVEESWVRVQAGVIRDELNAFLKPHGFFFSPITSTANRAMIGGMVGNNSSGTTSIVYGSTRDHVLELETILSDGSSVLFKAINEAEFQNKLTGNSLENKIYQSLYKELSQTNHQENIRIHFPKSSIHRRNTGYALDYLLETQIFSDTSTPFNFCKLLCGSEGTLAFTTEIKLHIDPLPPPHVVVLAAHFNDLQDSLKATQIAMQHQPTACELMDKIILDCTKANIEQNKNRFFINGDPAAVLMIEFRAQTLEIAHEKATQLSLALKAQKLGYAYPIIKGNKTKNVWALRSAGLGLLANIPGDEKAVACIEDTAVDINDLPEYIREFSEMIKKFDQRTVYYGHAGAGELHLRPLLNLKKSNDVEQFYQITEATATLVKKYKGSLSGEHGDGRLRAAFLPIMVGEENYELFKSIKNNWDPNHIFNPGKIVNAAPMNSSLRYEADAETPQFDTILDFSSTDGILRAAEKCNGSGDCRKLPLSGGTMCPSYQATRNEKDTTRARANILREFLTKNKAANPFDHEEIKAVMDLCLSCKGCTSECPSNVDMSSLKVEFLHQYYKTHGIPLRAKAFANINKLNSLGSLLPSISNFFLNGKIPSSILKNILNIAPQRSLPKLHKTSLKKWYQKNYSKLDKPKHFQKTIYLFCDEFTNFNDTPLGIKSIQLLNKLRYEVKLIDHAESGRAALSKGLLSLAKNLAIQNINTFKNLISSDNPLIGIEPSAILSFRDEYPRLVRKELQEDARSLGKNCLLIDEFIAQEIQKGNITFEKFTTEEKHILLHGHCHQKALSSIDHSAWLLSLPTNYTVEVIPSGCCGMAGSFGYEKEHYEVSMNIGEMVLFPAVRKAKSNTIIAATGTSCRHQIYDGTQQTAIHPIEILWNAVD